VKAGKQCERSSSLVSHSICSCDMAWASCWLACACTYVVFDTHLQLACMRGTARFSAAFCHLARTPIAAVPATLDCKPQVLYLAGGTRILPSHVAAPISSVCARQARSISPFTAVIGQDDMKLALMSHCNHLLVH
jgi:hypothetical protein